MGSSKDFPIWNARCPKNNVTTEWVIYLNRQSYCMEGRPRVISGYLVSEPLVFTLVFNKDNGDLSFLHQR